ncbi:hypothetical protein [Amycolatopsis sp. TNS106]|uniref:hypothetical protein n=1 Tax=Amycolatopsis sp. TNS106 TaxID=2861750 RepID=UPI001C5A13B9|nr:hypothetical protein [Amycolatopsis sp. TNS106]QXV57430.1 hypothetical protein CVV72_10805 [Amycolatopsis sp. TNS106]
MTTDSDVTVSAARVSTDATRREAARVSAVAALAFARQTHPELRRAEATARIDLAAAIIAMDATDDRIAAGENLHSMNEQTAVEEALRVYAQALANLVRREAERDEAGSSVLMPPR